MDSQGIDLCMRVRLQILLLYVLAVHQQLPDDPQAVKDSDDDGVADFYDLFPDDASEYKDSDGDGVGDSSDPMPFSDRYSSSTDLAVDGSMTIIALLILVLILRKLN